VDLASKYLQAADTYRDQLQPTSRATLDAYLKELAKARSALASRTASPLATPEVPGGRPVSPAPAVGRPIVATAASPAVANQNPASADTRPARSVVAARSGEQLHLGNYDVAQQKADAAETLDVKWGLFDDTPAKVTEEIKKSRPKAVSPAGNIARINRMIDVPPGPSSMSAGCPRQPAVRAGGSHRAGRQEMGPGLRPFRGQSR